MEEPVTFAMLAAQLRLGSDTSEQSLAEGYLLTAREWVEDHTGHIVAQREIIERVDAFAPRLRLSKGPFVEIASIAYVDAAGAPADYTGSEIRYEGKHVYVHAAAAGWPIGYRRGSIAITYLAGYEPLEVPQRFIMAILLLATDLYRNRSSGFSADAERSAAGLLRSFRNRVL